MALTITSNRLQFQPAFGSGRTKEFLYKTGEFVLDQSYHAINQGASWAVISPSSSIREVLIKKVLIDIAEIGGLQLVEPFLHIPISASRQCTNLVSLSVSAVRKLKSCFKK